MLIHLVSHIQNQRKQRHTHQHAVVTLTEDGQIGIIVEVDIELPGSLAGISGQGVHDHGVGLTVRRVDALVKPESASVQIRLFGTGEALLLNPGAVHDVDIVYSTRIQEERFASPEEADLYRGRFRLNQSVYTANCEPNTVIMHPLPRDSREGARELDIDLNDNPNLAIFRQSDNGVLVRMALFALILDVADQVDQHSAPVNWCTERRF